MIKLKQAVIVEGKYDKIKLADFIDAFIIPTDGFKIFKDKEKRLLIEQLAADFGVIIMTDSDSAGQLIRNYIKNFIKQGEIINVYLPQIKGKEKRKAAYSAEGFLGVEGIDAECIKKALTDSGVLQTESDFDNSENITKYDFYLLGISGRENSTELRKNVLKNMKLPTTMSANCLLEYINRSSRQEELKRVCEKCLKEKDRE